MVKGASSRGRAREASPSTSWFLSSHSHGFAGGNNFPHIFLPFKTIYKGTRGESLLIFLIHVQNVFEGFQSFVDIWSPRVPLCTKYKLLTSSSSISSWSVDQLCPVHLPARLHGLLHLLLISSWVAGGEKLADNHSGTNKHNTIKLLNF